MKICHGCNTNSNHKQIRMIGDHDEVNPLPLCKKCFSLVVEVMEKNPYNFKYVLEELKKGWKHFEVYREGFKL